MNIKNKKKYIKKIAIILLIFIFNNKYIFSYAEGQEKSPKKIIATTYFGNEWASNFWSREHRNEGKNFEQILKDGFNTLIFCIPWHEMQPDIYGDFNQVAIDEMHRMINIADEKGLNVMVRLGYTWDYYNNESSFTRYKNIWIDKQLKNAWNRYAKKMYEELISHKNFIGGFITWEDFWDGLFYTYGTNFAKIDKELMDLLINTQEVFNSLSMECRMHVDTMENNKGYSHEKTYGCGNAPYSSLLLSSSMRQPNYATIPASSAISMSSSIIDDFSQCNKPIFIDQFLYTESTPGYEFLSKVDDLHTYLVGMGDVFKNKTIGYGLWTYQDYIDNLIYNSEFALADEGWTFANAEKAEIGDNKVAYIKKGGSIKQDISWKGFLSDKQVFFEMEVIGVEEGDIDISVCDQTKTVHIVPGVQVVKLEFENKEKNRLVISSNTKTYVDNIRLYSHVTTGGIYKVDGTEDKYITAIRQLNAKLQ